MTFKKRNIQSARGSQRAMFTQYIKNHFGSKRGLLRAYVGGAARYLGRYKQFAQIDFSKVNRLVFICNGNICRSPLGEAVAKMHGVDSISYGLDTRGGDHADPRAIAFGANKQVLFGHHKTRKINEYKPMPGDLLVGMEPRHTSQLILLYGNKVQITLMGLWLKRPTAYLHDPYNTNVIFFNHCESMVEQATTALVAKVKEKK